MRTLNFLTNLFAAYYRAATSGKTFADETAERKKVCDSCSFKSEFNFCLDCGCWLKIKQRDPMAFCPRNKWKL